MRALRGLAPHHVIHCFHREQGAGMARVSRLTTATALTPRAMWSRAVGRVARRGTRGVPCGLVQLLLPCAVMLLERLHHGLQCLHTRFQCPNRGLRFGRELFPHVVGYGTRCFHGDRVCYAETGSQALSFHYLNGYLCMNRLRSDWVHWRLTNTKRSWNKSLIFC